MIQIAKISTIDTNEKTTRVILLGRQNVVSAELPILMPFVKTEYIELPKVNDRVLCIFLGKSQGFIIGKF